MKLKFEGHTCKVFGVTFPILYEGERPYIDISGQRAYEGDRVTYNFTIHRSDYIKINTEEIPNASFEKISDYKKMFTYIPDEVGVYDPERLLKLTPNPPDTHTRAYSDIIEDISLKFSLLKAEDKKIVISSLKEQIPEEPVGDLPMRKIGTLTKTFGMKDGTHALETEPVYEDGDRYCIYFGKTLVSYYKSTLHPYIHYDKE